ncbi:MAG: hypothetical protein WAW26_23080, partial [Anaerolineae bacterium]
SLVFNHRDHKERREVADLRLICRFFVFSVLFVVECVLHLELLQIVSAAATFSQMGVELHARSSPDRREWR